MSGTDVIDISNMIWHGSSEYTEMSQAELQTYGDDGQASDPSFIPIELTHTLKAGKTYEISQANFNTLFRLYRAEDPYIVLDGMWNFKLIIKGTLNITASNAEATIPYYSYGKNLFTRKIQVDDGGEFNSNCPMVISLPNVYAPYPPIPTLIPFDCSGTINFNDYVNMYGRSGADGGDLYLKVNKNGIINLNGFGTFESIINNGRINSYLGISYYKKFLQNGQLYNYSGTCGNDTLTLRGVLHLGSLVNAGKIYNYDTIRSTALPALVGTLLENSGGTIYNYPNASINFVNVATKERLLSAFINKNGIINNLGFIQFYDNHEASVISDKDLDSCDICGTVFTVRRPFNTNDNIYDKLGAYQITSPLYFPIKGEISEMANIDGVSMKSFQLNYNSGEDNPFEYILIENITETLVQTAYSNYIKRLSDGNLYDHITFDASSHLIIPSDLSMINTIKFENNGKISNSGTFGVSGELSNNEFAIINNSGTLDVFGGTIHNNGTIKNTGAVIYQTLNGNSITTGGAVGTTGGAVGDPYIVPLNGVGVWKMPNFEGFSRMLQGIYKGKELTINAKTTFNSEEEIKETIKFATQGLEHLGVDCSHLLKTHKMVSKNESFIRELWIRYDKKETYLNLETLQMTGNDFTLNKTSEAAYLIDYNCHESNNIQVNIADDLFIIASNFDNPQVKTGFNIKGDTKSIQNSNGVLCNKLYKEDMIIKSITDIEPISQTQDRKPKGHSNEIYFTSDGEKMTKKINLY